MLGRVHTGRAALAAAKACVPGRRGRAGPRGRHDDPDSPSSTATAGPCNPSNQQAATHMATACCTFPVLPWSRCCRGHRAAVSRSRIRRRASEAALVSPVRLGPAGDCRASCRCASPCRTGSRGGPCTPCVSKGFDGCSSVGEPVTRLCQPTDPRPSLSRSCCSWAATGLQSVCSVNTTRPRRSRAGPGATAVPGAGRTARLERSVWPGSHPAGRATLDQEGHGPAACGAAEATCALGM